MNTKPVSAAFTEQCTEDKKCERIACNTILKAGEPRFYVTSSVPEQATKSKWVCCPCYKYYQQKEKLEISSTRRQEPPGSIRDVHVNESHRENSKVDTASIRRMVNSAQRKGSTVEQRAVQHIPPLSPLPNPERGRMNATVQVPLRGPTVSMPASWLTVRSGTRQPSKARVSTPAMGYSAAHKLHAEATLHWRSTAYAPGDNIDIIMQVHHEIVQTKKKLSKPVWTLAEGKQVSASMSGADLAKLAIDTMLLKLKLLTKGDFEWDTQQFKVRDAHWKDMSLSTDEGYFGKECFKIMAGKDKKIVFVRPKVPFDILVVMALEHWHAYNDYVESCEIDDGRLTGHIGGTNPKSTIKAANTSSKLTIRLPPRPPLFTELATPREDLVPSSKQTRNSVPSMANDKLKRKHPDDVTPKTPPATKRQQTYKSPDQQRLQHAMTYAGSLTNLNVTDYSGRSERIEFTPIIVPSFDNLIDTIPSMRSCPLEFIRQGTLFIPIDSDIGIGSFKTCNAGRISLIGPALDAGIYGHEINFEVVVKRFYIPDSRGVATASTSRSKARITRLSLDVECKKTLMEANILCWATSLMEFGYDYIDHRLDELTSKQRQLGERMDHAEHILLTRLAPVLPRLRFVRGAIVKRFEELHDKENNVTATYLVEEKIANRSGFTKYINNGSAEPLIVDATNPGYKICMFLCSMQHVLFFKTMGKLFLSDFQGDGDLLTDPQIMTSGNIGFGDGNVTAAFKAFPEQHECNDYCTLLGLPELK